MFAGAFLIARDNIGIICDICSVNFSPAHFEPVFNIPLPCCSYLPVPIITSPTCVHDCCDPLRDIARFSIFPIRFGFEIDLKALPAFDPSWTC